MLACITEEMKVRSNRSFQLNTRRARKLENMNPQKHVVFKVTAILSPEREKRVIKKKKQCV